MTEKELNPNEMFERMVALVGNQRAEIKRLRSFLPGPFEVQPEELEFGSTRELQFRAWIKIDHKATNGEQLRRVNRVAAEIVASEPGRWTDARGRGRFIRISKGILSGDPDAELFWQERTFRQWRKDLRDQVAEAQDFFCGCEPLI